MGHAPEDLPRAQYHRRVAQPAAPTHRDPARSIRIAAILLLLSTILVAAAFAWRNAIVMKLARVYQQKQLAGLLEARDDGSYRFTYDAAFHGEPVSLTMPTSQRVWEFSRFPAPFEGLLPEGVQLDALLRLRKLDRQNLFGQLLAVGHDVVGSLRIEATS